MEPKCKVIEDPTGSKLDMSTTITPRDLLLTDTSHKTRRAKPTDPGGTKIPKVQHKQQEVISVAHEANTINAVSNFVAGNIAKHIPN